METEAIATVLSHFDSKEWMSPGTSKPASGGRIKTSHFVLVNITS
jgi:hypothetical protein